MIVEVKPEQAIYELEEVVGQGLSSTVYRATRVDSRRLARQTVALKILKSETAISWLRHEFDTLKRVRSPHCVQVLAWENLPDGCALVLEWIDGVTLLDLLRQRHLSDQAIRDIVAQIYEGLMALRRQGLHHGDLSPANVLINSEGTVKLIDFATAPPEKGVVHGTLAYVAPEVWNGGSGDIASDFFALGLIRRDLQTRMTDFPLTAAAAQERALRLSEEKEGLLARDPRCRNLSDLFFDLDARREVGENVRRIVEERRMSRIATVRFRSKSADLAKRFNFFRRVVGLFFVFSILVSLPGGAEAPPLSLVPTIAAPAELILRSQEWLEVTLNGKFLGYAPLDIKGLPAGGYRIQWKTAIEAGSLHIFLNAGQKLRLTARDLEVQSRTGKH